MTTKVDNKPDADRVNFIVGLVTGLIALAMYLKTVAPSISFWDCGEFVAASVIFGIPHPPGSPVFILVGKIFSAIPFADDMAYRVNLISALSSAASVFIAYFVTGRIIDLWKTSAADIWQRIGKYAGGVVGALCLGFNRTFWTNAVEAEVYGLTMLVFLITAYLLVEWYSKRNHLSSDRILVLVIYLAVLGSGTHMSAFLILPAGLVFVLLSDKRLRTDPRFWVLCIAVLSLVMYVELFLYGVAAWLVISVAGALSSRKDTARVESIIQKEGADPEYLTVKEAANSLKMNPKTLLNKLHTGEVPAQRVGQDWRIARLQLATWFARGTGSSLWRLSAALAVAALLAFSIQFYVPIRSSFNPSIDMNNPDNFKSLVSFIEREQYGHENMITRMFTRRGELANQFGDFPRMGFSRFFSEQYSKPGIMFALFLALGLYGLYAALKRNWQTGSFVFLLVLAGTIGLTLYMNFADGTQIDPATMARRLEVRDRDYFWTPGFAVFGICIGLGVAAIHRFILGTLASSSNAASLAKPVSLALAVIMLFLPVVSVAHNYRACDRTFDTLPYDYAYNVLSTCEEGSILFTAGDNDTFPLWALQYGLGVRPDVRIVNLSLLDTDWYAVQMRDNLNVPISLTDGQIMQFPTEISAGTQRVILPLPKERYYDPMRKQNRLLRTFQDETGRVVRVAHQLIENILLNNQWEYPVYFANQPPSEVGFDLRQHSEIVGVLYRVTKEPRNGAINIDESYRLFTEVYQLRGLGNPKYYKDETATTMALGMAQKYYDLYSELTAIGDTVRAPEVFYDVIDKAPEFWQPSMIRASVDSTYGIEGKSDTEYKEEYLAFVEQLLEYAPDNFYYYGYKGIVLQALGRYEEGIEVLEAAYDMMPTSAMTYRSLMTAYIGRNQTAKAVALSRRYLALNPYDESARRLISAYGQ